MSGRDGQTQEEVVRTRARNDRTQTKIGKPLLIECLVECPILLTQLINSFFEIDQQKLAKYFGQVVVLQTALADCSTDFGHIW